MVSVPRSRSSHEQGYFYINGHQILTFDDRGISLHPNHISLLSGTFKLLSDPNLHACDANATHSLLPPYTECLRRQNLRIFALRTVGIIPKYSGVLGVAAKRLQLLSCGLMNGFLPLKMCQRETTFISSWKEYVTAILAMMQHRSQLVWFRWLYVTWSRYMWINDWTETLA